MDADRLRGYIKFLVKFAGKMDDIDSEFRQVIEHLQTMDEELGGEAQEMSDFLQNELVPMSRKQAEGEVSKQDLARLVSDEESVRRSLEKVMNDLDTEIQELKNFLSDLTALEQKAQQADDALGKIEKVESQTV